MEVMRGNAPFAALRTSYFVLGRVSDAARVQRRRWRSLERASMRLAGAPTARGGEYDSLARRRHLPMSLSSHHSNLALVTIAPGGARVWLSR